MHKSRSQGKAEGTASREKYCYRPPLISRNWPDISHRWEWQLGRLLEKQGSRKRAIAAYKEAVKTLKSVRSDLLTIDSDVQFSFRDNVEPIHRKLVDLLLKTEGSSQASQADLKEAIEVIDSLQLAELENFL